MLLVWECLQILHILSFFYNIFLPKIGITIDNAVVIPMCLSIVVLFLDRSIFVEEKCCIYLIILLSREVLYCTINASYYHLERYGTHLILYYYHLLTPPTNLLNKEHGQQHNNQSIVGLDCSNG